jgi:hypothetical protein
MCISNAFFLKMFQDPTLMNEKIAELSKSEDPEIQV